MQVNITLALFQSNTLFVVAATLAYSTYLFIDNSTSMILFYSISYYSEWERCTSRECGGGYKHAILNHKKNLQKIIKNKIIIQVWISLEFHDAAALTQQFMFSNINYFYEY